MMRLLALLLMAVALASATSYVDTLRGDGVSTPNDWSVQGAYSTADSAVMLPDDDWTSRIAKNVPSEGQCFTLSAPTIPGDAVVDAFVIVCRAVEDEAGGVILTRVYYGGDSTSSANHELTASFANYYDTLACPDGGSWTAAKLASATIAVWTTATSVPLLVATTMYAIVTAHDDEEPAIVNLPWFD